MPSFPAMRVALAATGDGAPPNVLYNLLTPPALPCAVLYGAGMSLTQYLALSVLGCLSAAYLSWLFYLRVSAHA